MSGNNGLPVRDPKDWVTGNDAPTDAQKGFLAKLVSDKGVRQSGAATVALTRRLHVFFH